MALRVTSVASVQRPAEGRDRQPTLVQIAVGNNLNQVGSVHGDTIVVNVAGRTPPPLPRGPRRH